MKLARWLASPEDHPKRAASRHFGEKRNCLNTSRPANYQELLWLDKAAGCVAPAFEVEYATSILTANLPRPGP